MTTHHWPVYGHDWAIEHLRKGIANGRTRHAYLIVGTESIGKETLARAFAMALNCTHADEAARPCGVCSACDQSHSDAAVDPQPDGQTPTFAPASRCLSSPSR